MTPKVKVTHLDNGLGSLYLADIGRRWGLGGGVEITEYGQDQYLNPGQEIELVATSQVLMSIQKGMLGKYAAKDDLSIEFL